MTQQSNNQYLAVPPSGKGPGVLVLHAWWGLTDVIRNLCDRLALDGFVALAPDLFSGTLLHTVEEAEQHIHQWDEEQAVPPILSAAVDTLRHHPAVSGDGLGVMGFSMGAYWTLWLAQQQPDLFRAAVIFYGTNGGEGNFQPSRAAFLGHFAENDPYEPPESVAAMEKALRGAGRAAAFYTYPGTGHWFFESDRPEAYNAPAAQLAYTRTVDFLHQQLGGSKG